MEDAQPVGAAAAEIREFIVQNFLFGEDGQTLGDEDSFLETGIIDSTGVLELIGFIEERYFIQVDDEDLIPENLDSVSRVVAYINGKLRA